jgi:hypothetical protein
MRQLQGSVDNLGASLSGSVRNATRFGLAVFGFGEAAESVRRVIDLSTRAVQQYGETNAEVAALIAGTSERFEELGAAIGRAIVGGDQANETFAALQGVAVALTNAVRDNEAAISDLARGAIAGVIDALSFAIRVGVTFANALDGIKIAVVGAAVGISQFGLAIADGVLGTVSAATTAIRDLLQGLESIVETSARVARGLGQRGLANELEGVLSRINRFSDSTQGFRADIEGMRDSIDATSDALRDGLNRDIEDLTARVAQREQYTELARTLSNLADQYREGAITATAFRGQVEGATQAVEEQANAFAGLFALLERGGLGKLVEQQRLAKAATDAEAQALRELVMARKAEAETKAADQLARADAERLRTEAQIDANRALAASYLDLGQAIGEGSTSITEAVRDEAVNQLKIQILQYIGQAAALSATGRIAAAVALGGAIGVMRASLAKLGGGGSSTGSGSVGVAPANRTVQNINVSVAQTNGFGAGVDSTRAIADAVNTGVRRGLIEVAR